MIVKSIIFEYLFYLKFVLQFQNKIHENVIKTEFARGVKPGYQQAQNNKILLELSHLVMLCLSWSELPTSLINSGLKSTLIDLPLK